MGLFHKGNFLSLDYYYKVLFVFAALKIVDFRWIGMGSTSQEYGFIAQSAV
ncbi:tail fiber domain-containing protein [Aquimarina algicola]|uniref:Tail fiber domain-containing protein n=1 Tax=Aquimarina algicola TaxID=2589995 RepID=A0A504J479_9FLAO|nr:tail fiber domain-containing protein [Aquimarina algicola]